jgi:radical SAM superfamily enzyme YgiQ (UPF0313 family)
MLSSGAKVAERSYRTGIGQKNSMKPVNVLMVFPRFLQNSFWSLQAVCAVWGTRCPAPPLGLLTLAALLPHHWNVRLVDRNAQALTEGDLAWADMVMTGGMLPQRPDTLNVIQLAQEHGKPVVVGGPDAMSSPEIYSAADFRVLGEAEGILAAFVQAWEAGQRSGVFRAERFKVDLATSPIPRFDLIDFRHYLYVGVQFSRGCPFNCEFCDIIELYGRVPRPKGNAQMLAELQALHDAGYRGHVDFVDDNLIGNKRALKRFLPELCAWQKERGYPFRFSTEASLNLADDAELLGLMSAANFFAIFTGIESPDTETLVHAQKKQNTRRNIAESVNRIYAAGMFVIAGFIVGFDTEKSDVADGMIACIETTSIPVCMVGLLTALPDTQLSRRLAREGRLPPLEFVSTAEATGDQCTAGLNFIPLRPRARILADYKAVLAAIYQPDSYFARVREVGRLLRRPRHREKFEPRVVSYAVAALGRLVWQMTVKRPRLLLPFWRTLLSTAWRNPRALEFVLILTAFYLHLGPFAAFVMRHLEREISAEPPAPPGLASAIEEGSLVALGS